MWNWLVTQRMSARGEISVMSDNPRVAVIIPTHDRAYCLGRALNSVRRQTRPADQIIVIDDGSEDETASLMASEYPDVDYIYQQHAGVSAARNRGIDASNCEWLAFLDSDDEWMPDKLAVQLNALADNPEYLITHGNEVWIRNGRRVNPMQKHEKSGGWIFEQCLPMCRISPSAAVIHRRIFDDVGYFDTELPACEDYDLWLRVTSRYPVLMLDQSLIKKYGGHEDQLSRRHPAMDRFRVQALLKILASKDLPSKCRIAAVRMLVEKITIYTGGAKKRHKNREVAHYLAIKSRFQDELQQLC
jgi:glycosyltransferase involved in cell wall biosynthesis